MTTQAAAASTLDLRLAPTAFARPDLGDCTGDSEGLRKAFARFPSGVAALSTTVSGEDGSAEHLVLLVSSFQVGISLDPPLILFAVQHTSTSWPRLKQAAASGKRIGASVLAEQHASVARQLAAKHGDRFAGLASSTTSSGAHYLHGAALWLECSIESEVRAGDHDVVLLRVHAAGSNPDVRPLVWHASAFTSLVIQHP